jgi:hypothetical protein
MDKRFLEFLGHSLIHAAKGQQQMENLTQWITQGLRGFEDLTTMFRESYGLNRWTENSPDYLKAWQQATDEFKKSYEDYLRLFGVVPKQAYIELERKYQDLKEKTAAQEETIKQLRILLQEKGVDGGEVVKAFHGLMKKQTEQFQDLMKSFGLVFDKDSGEVDPKKGV